MPSKESTWADFRRVRSRFGAALASVAGVALGIGFLQGGALRAEPVDYTVDKLLVDTTVNTASVAGRLVTVAELFALVENQTDLKFFYVADRIPIDRQLILESGKVMSLAELFSTVSPVANVIFKRQDKRIVVRRPLPNNGGKAGSASPSPGQSSPP